MFYKDIRYVINELDRAVDALSRAQGKIMRSDAINSADKEYTQLIYKEASELRVIKKSLKEKYKDMNEPRRT